MPELFASSLSTGNPGTYASEKVYLRRNQISVRLLSVPSPARPPKAPACLSRERYKYPGNCTGENLVGLIYVYQAGAWWCTYTCCTGEARDHAVAGSRSLTWKCLFLVSAFAEELLTVILCPQSILPALSLKLRIVLALRPTVGLNKYFCEQQNQGGLVSYGSGSWQWAFPWILVPRLPRAMLSLSPARCS